ncbi:histidine kinase [Mucilaginibacter sp. PPCGB 2223]|uniref:response regulator transcription factor n=1 Tax=Mucilaginibacter sp. PPCGB 2223 TaxID=1886027 RepID=UPI000824C5C1|nr:response regulator [Mucilaginibacter sp. PPCGB 2223]OCX51804.1 histidine kinase [Mucilaginibacter sp. PPCGB 2223]
MCKKILVLDDDLAILDALGDVLEYGGYDVCKLSRGDEIFEQIEDYHPDLILLDVMLADRDGREICKQIKLDENHEISNIPVIMISATHDLSKVLNQRGAPDDFVAKPFDIDNLLNKIELQLAA